MSGYKETLWEGTRACTAHICQLHQTSAGTPAPTDTPWILHDILKAFPNVNYHTDCTNVYIKFPVSGGQNMGNTPNLIFFVIIHVEIEVQFNISY